MKKYIALSLCMLFTASALTGCSKTEYPESTATSAPPSVTAAAPTATPEATSNYPAALTTEQLAGFQTALTSQENYGFLFSNYDDVRDADLMQVFYTGAGMKNPDNSDEIEKGYEAEYGPDESDVDSTILTTKQFDAFLTAKTGYTLSEMNNLPDWSYVKEYDAYIHYHGDTNYVEVSCTGGREISKNLFEVNYTIPGGMADSDGNFLSGGTVTVKNTGDKMQFVSNSLH